VEQVRVLQDEGHELAQRRLRKRSEVVAADAARSAADVPEAKQKNPDRGRDRRCRRPPAQIPACTASALGVSLGCSRRTARRDRDVSRGRVVAIGRRADSCVCQSRRERWLRRRSARDQCLVVWVRTAMIASLLVGTA
jgi:hypothetical protein